MSVAVPKTAVPSASPKTRLKVAISFDDAYSRLVFTLSELSPEERDTKDHFPVTTGVVNDVSREKLEEKAREWRQVVRYYEKQFNETCESLREKLISELGGADATSREFLEYASTHRECAETINEASTVLAEEIGRSIVSLSYDLLQKFLPEEDTDFCRVLIKELDTPTLVARGSDDPNSWWDIPLVQLRIERELLCIPWWLARTYDKTSLWCGRYALAVSPSLHDTEPPAMLMEKEGGVHILSITRPTFDLQKWFPISQATANDALGLISEGVLSWRLLDGVLGDENLESVKTDLFEESTTVPKIFKGVDKDTVRNAVFSKQRRPNVVVYQGHWFNEWKDTFEDPPFLGLHDGRFQSKPESLSFLSTGVLPVPLLDFVPDKSQHKILIMNACDSAAPINQGRLIQKYIEARSVFIGANYPLLADNSGPSLDSLIRSILRNRYLAHAVSEVNTLETDLNSPTVDVREVFRKAGLCLFGDVQTSLRKKFDETVNDNLARLTMKLTDKWAIELHRLGLRTYEGMTFITNPDDKPPDWNFRLTGPSPELALVPLVVAIDLCNSEQDDYVILGPAFSSAESVALVAPKFKDWAAFENHLALCIRSNKRLAVGLLAKRLTSTYMTELFLRGRMEKVYRSVTGNTLPGNEIWDRFIKRSYARDAQKLKDSSFVKKMDLSLVLDASTETLETLGKVLAPDVETQVADLLSLKEKLLPRGILITRREYLEAQNESEEILNFCHAFNTKVEEISKFPPANSADGQPDSIALPTAGKANPEHLNSIRTFAETDFFTKRHFGWENFLYKPRAGITRIEAGELFQALEKTNWSDRSLGIFSRSTDGKVGALVADFGKKMTSLAETTEYWHFADLKSALNENLRELSVAEVIKEDIVKRYGSLISALSMVELA
jgi:hypothetical protein